MVPCGSQRGVRVDTDELSLGGSLVTSEMSHPLCGVTRHYRELGGPVDVKFEFGWKEESLSVCMADIEDPCMVGMHCRCELDFCSMPLTVGGRRCH